MNKRGGSTNIYVALVVAFVSLIIMISMSRMSGKFNSYKIQIGTSQFALLKTYERGEEALNYLDTSFDLSLKQAIYNMAQKGGLSDPECGLSGKGYSFWNNGDTLCPPDNPESSLAAETSRLQKTYFQGFPNEAMPELDYSYSVSSDGKKIEMSATHGTKLRIDITDEKKYNFKKESMNIQMIDDNSANKFGTFSIIPPVAKGALVASCFENRAAYCSDCKPSNHEGIDFAISIGTDVMAVSNGIVISAVDDSAHYKDAKIGNWQEYGTRIIIEHDYNGLKYWTLYAHLSQALAKEGDTVSQGQVIGKSGNTGKSGGPHLHFEIRGLENDYAHNLINPICIAPDFLKDFTIWDTNYCRGELNKGICDYQQGYIWALFRDEMSKAVSISNNPETDPNTLTNECGDSIVKIAMEGLGHEYDLGAKEWNPAALPPDGAKTDCGAFTKWAYNRYALLSNNEAFHIDNKYSQGNGRNAYPQAKNIGHVVDHDPLKDWDKFVYTSPRHSGVTPDCKTLQAGDLVFFTRTYNDYEVSHVGIFIGGDKCEMIQAGGSVEIVSLRDDPYWSRYYIGARRVCPDASPKNPNAISITGEVVDIVNSAQSISKYSPFVEDYYDMGRCKDNGGVVCLANETCFGQKIYSENYTSCCLGKCGYIFDAHETPPELVAQIGISPDNYINDNNTIIVEAYPQNTLKEQPDAEQINYIQIIIVIGALITITTLIIYFIRKSKIITISLICLLFLGFGIFSFNGRTNGITGKVSFTEGEEIKASVTRYYTPYDRDFASWCSPVGFCFETISQVRDYYPNEETCLNGRGGWCCVEDKGFYEDVKCQGSGYVVFQDEQGTYYKKTHYNTIKTTKENTVYNEKETIRGGKLLTARTIACPDEFPDGTQFYIDYGSDNRWSGCYACKDHGSAIYIEPDGTVRLDLYAGIGKVSLDAVRKEANTAPKVYYGCAGKTELPLPDIQPGSSTGQSGTGGEITVAKTRLVNVPPEILKGEKMGYYYLTPSLYSKADFDLGIYSELSARVTSFLLEYRDCINNPEASETSSKIKYRCANNFLESLPATWKYSGCQDENSCSEINFDYDTGYRAYAYSSGKYEEKPVIIKFAVKLSS